VFSDTVGFIRDLPHHLIDAFRATLEEAAYADLILHVIDAANENLFDFKKIVEDVLVSLGAKGKKMVLALNKCDLLNEGEINYLKSEIPQALFISARQGKGLEALMQAVRGSILNPVLTVGDT